MTKSKMIKVAMIVGAMMTLSQCLDTDLGNMWAGEWETETGNYGDGVVTSGADPMAAPVETVPAGEPSYDPLSL